MDKKAGNDHNSGREPSNQRYRRRKLTDFGAVTLLKFTVLLGKKTFCVLKF
jgi:hypothetical protein